MKILAVLLSFISITMLVMSCTKTVIKPAAIKNADTAVLVHPHSPLDTLPVSATLVGRWKLVSDSTNTYGMPISGPRTGSTYAGQPGDYFNIAANGQVLIKESSQTDTAKYVAYTDNSRQLLYKHLDYISIVGGGWVTSSLQQSNVTDHSATITTDIVTTMGAHRHIYTLEK